MKKLNYIIRIKGLVWIVALVALLSGAGSEGALAAGKDKKDKGVMTFKETVHDFGSIKESGGPVSVEFPFTNSGTANLLIYEAKAECGCTTPEFPQAPVAPGKTGRIKVTYNPLGRPGAFDKVITVKTNGKPGKVRLKIRGSVIPKSK